ncbi:monocarboxylate transporter 12-like [Mytilus galloprovincialis]|uniref:monocarboxylate transporter 12-like n=1 Tax=Mytilus galloprovincialis TaxID=29158 RepID=UPI003F7BE6C8
MTDKKDSGYSWMILIGSSINYFISVGVMKLFGMLYSELLETYDSAAGRTAFINSLQIFIMAAVSPLAGLLSTTYSFRVVTFTGSIIVGLGITISGFTTNPDMLYLTYGIIAGIGFGFVYSPSVTIVNYYFHKKKALANGIVGAASGVSTIVLPVLYRTVFDVYGLHGGLIVLGGFCLNLCVGSVIFKQPELFSKVKNTIVHNSKNFTTSDGILGKTTSCFFDSIKIFKSILKSRTFIFYAFAFSFAILGYVGNFVIIPPHLRSRGVENSNIVKILTTSGVGELTGRILVGLIIDKKYVKPEILFTGSMIISGIFCIVFPFFDAVWMNYFYCIYFGLVPGSVVTLIPLMIISATNLQVLTPAFALSLLLNDTFCLLGFPLSGWLEDMTGTWDASFYFLGGSQVMAAVFAYTGFSYYSKYQTKESQNPTDDDKESIPMIK